MFKKLSIYFTLLIFVACTDEFMPEPVGEVVSPAEHALLTEVLSASDYSLFNAAWERSNIDQVITEEYPNAKMLFLIPTDEAMQAAGYTAANINNAAIDDLDALVRYHVLNGHITHEQLLASVSDQIFSSLLIHPEFKEGIKSGISSQITVPYRYQHHLLALEDNKLIDNGKTVATNEWIPVDKGSVIPIHQIAEMPTKQMIDILREDERFSLFLSALEMNVIEYDDYYIQRRQFRFYQGFQYLTDWYYTTKNGFRSEELPPHIIRFTLFAPTNDAFHQVGIYTQNDLKRLNQRSVVQYNGNTLRSTPSDSLLYLHRISAEALAPISGSGNTTLRIATNTSGANTVFYDHMLTNGFLRNYALTTIAGNSFRPTRIDYDFGRNPAGQVTIKQEGASAVPATIIEASINTFQGPIHVVDKLIVPKGFEMWHLGN